MLTQEEDDPTGSSNSVNACFVWTLTRPLFTAIPPRARFSTKLSVPRIPTRPLLSVGTTVRSRHISTSTTNRAGGVDVQPTAPRFVALGWSARLVNRLWAVLAPANCGSSTWEHCNRTPQSVSLHEDINTSTLTLLTHEELAEEAWLEHALVAAAC